MKYYLALIVSLSISLFGCKSGKKIIQLEEQPGQMIIKWSPNDTTNIIGKVSYMETNEPILDARIKFTDKAGKYLTFNTNDVGNFNAKNLPIGKYKLTVSADGYKIVSYNITIKEKTNYQLEIKLVVQPIKIEKPVIYLYPTCTQKVHVSIKYKGIMSHTYPTYPKEGWQVSAEPNGTLFDDYGKEYYALFWEGIPHQEIVPKDGFIVSGKETATFLEEKLAYLGLNRREANEFIMYWLPRMEDNPYNLIHFAGAEYLNQAELSIQPKPESMIRIMMITQALHSKINFPMQDLKPLKKTRKGFTVVEWGGSETHSILPNS